MVHKCLPCFICLYCEYTLLGGPLCKDLLIYSKKGRSIASLGDWKEQKQLLVTLAVTIRPIYINKKLHTTIIHSHRPSGVKGLRGGSTRGATPPARYCWQLKGPLSDKLLKGSNSRSISHKTPVHLNNYAYLHLPYFLLKFKVHNIMIIEYTLNVAAATELMHLPESKDVRRNEWAHCLMVFIICQFCNS